MYEEDTEVDYKRANDSFERDLDNVTVLEFSQGPLPSQVSDRKHLFIVIQDTQGIEISAK